MGREFIGRTVLEKVGLDPHAGLDKWWLYDYFSETVEYLGLRPGRWVASERRVGFGEDEVFNCDEPRK